MFYISGYGFVDFDSPAAAQKAVSALKASGVQAQMAKVSREPVVTSLVPGIGSDAWDGALPVSIGITSPSKPTLVTSRPLYWASPSSVIVLGQVEATDAILNLYKSQTFLDTGYLWDINVVFSSSTMALFRACF